MKKLIKRTLNAPLQKLAKQFPVLAVFGPRQSGKTTLVKEVFPQYKYINLELFENQQLAQEDPRGFLKQFENEPGVILDEIQNTPKLFSYIQVEVDEKQKEGHFILTGSQNILLNQRVSQTLAGRVALTTLLPLSIEELRLAKQLPTSSAEAIFKGFYPRVYQNDIDPVVFADSYVRTYIERDVRDIKNITSLTEFQKFMRLCAGRTGQLLNLSALANESALSLKTVKSWLSILQASYVIFLLEPFHQNFNKRVVKMPKLYFYDTSLACNLLRITKAEDVFEHYLKGGLFESMIISNFFKMQYHQLLPPNLYFWRDKLGNEVDCLQEDGQHLRGIEIKAGETFNSSMLDGLKKWSSISQTPLQNSQLTYGGSKTQKINEILIQSWRNL